MKKVIIFLTLVLCLFLTGCGKDNVKDKLFNNIDKIKGYYLEATMEIVNNDDVYEYDVKVSYYKGDNYKVELSNTSNNYEQIIIKNSDGVYVITPLLNKSFKFQSEWPYNNSQAYLLHSIKNDLEKADDLVIESVDDGYIFKTSNVNYPNNEKLTHQEVLVDKNMDIKQVTVMDDNNIPQITVNFNTIDKDATFDSNYFQIDESKYNTDTKEDTSEKESADEKEVDTPTMSEGVFPLYLPTETTLSDQEKVNKDDGERIIMTFSGEKSFLLVQENSTIYEDFTIIPTTGEPFMLIDTIGSLTDESITWSSSGIDYYIVSDVMTQKELIEVARSINALPVMK
ncbi:MAG TPA: hypothetical protein PLT65_04665 [Bacilli bacterium]|nr:hypothetical protein [Bacilli bacterium]